MLGAIVMAGQVRWMGGVGDFKKRGLNGKGKVSLVWRRQGVCDP